MEGSRALGRVLSRTLISHSSTLPGHWSLMLRAKVNREMDVLAGRTSRRQLQQQQVPHGYDFPFKYHQRTRQAA
ncbi:hypothetical protein RRG08_062621 [Elysia crispata]|uniref:Uncharacterized protein n=1 Tax=Elysia crispata TaxID=231223 RepID=A0AAE0YYD6_9GAST|nr:hypothetical protein RRG08_062621 [Elysia crispata]